MKNGILFVLIFTLIIGCSSTKSNLNRSTELDIKTKDTIVIANKEIEYEIIIIDIGFNSWLASNARPRQFYSLEYLEARNRFWVLEWNSRATNLMRNNTNLYEMLIDYQSNIDYGYEVNYMLFNYLTFFQLRNNTQFGSFMARI